MAKRKSQKHPKKSPLLHPQGRQVRTPVVENHLRKNPAWQFRIADLNGDWGWASLSRETWLNNIFEKFRNFESMTWAEILQARGGRNRGNNSHYVPIENLSTAAQRRLQELHQDDVDELFSLRLSGTERVWGIMQGRVLRIIWYDPDHEVCPMTGR